MKPVSAREAFFIGWSNKPAPALARFLAIVMLFLVLGLGLLGYGLSRWADDPTEGLLRLGERQADGGIVPPGPWGNRTVFRGSLLHLGYPLLYLPPDAANPHGKVLLMASSNGKRGAEVPMINGPVEIQGSVAQRGAIDMLIVNEAKPLDGSMPEFPAPARQSLGRWRIAGEVCDGKCYVGIMRPGSGVSHRACANLCLIGGVPPILVTFAPVAGSSFLSLAGPDGDPPPERLRDLIAIPVEMEGDVERVGNVLVLKIDPAKLRPL